MFKKILVLGIIVTILVTNVGNVFAANPIVSVSSHGYDDGYIVRYSDITKDYVAPIVLLFVNGDVISDADAIIKNGTTLVPLRVISDKLGALANWDSSTRSVEIVKDDIIIKLNIGDKNITVNGENIVINSVPEIINSLTYVPLRAVASGFGAEVGYVDYTNDLKIVYVQDRDDEVIVTENEAIKKAENLYFNEFLPTMREFILDVWNVDTNYVNSSNISEKLNMNYVGRCKADLGEYYYIELFDDTEDAVLVDKYDGLCYCVHSFSLVLIGINYGDAYASWGLQYQ